MVKSPTPTKICQHRPGRKSREKSELSGHVGSCRERSGIGRDRSGNVGVSYGGAYEEVGVVYSILKSGLTPSCADRAAASKPVKKLLSNYMKLPSYAR